MAHYAVDIRIRIREAPLGIAVAVAELVNAVIVPPRPIGLVAVVEECGHAAAGRAVRLGIRVRARGIHDRGGACRAEVKKVVCATDGFVADGALHRQAEADHERHVAVVPLAGREGAFQVGVAVLGVGAALNGVDAEVHAGGVDGWNALRGVGAGARGAAPAESHSPVEVHVA